MPLYEYICRDCRHEFEALVRHGEAPTCVGCGSASLERQHSLFAVSSDATRKTVLNRARRENLKTETDKAVAARDYENKHAH